MLASALTSQLISKRQIHDRRGLELWSIWGIFLGCLNHHWQALVARRGPSSLLGKLAIDHIMWKVPILYAFVTYERMMRGSTLLSAWRQSVKANPPMQLTALKIFPLTQVLNFTVVPVPLRVLYMNTVLFFWCIYLALKLRTTK